MITNNLIRRCSSKHKIRNADVDNYESKLTHLYLQDRELETIDNLHSCTNLSTLYLYDNKIRKIQNLHPVVNLTSLYLQNNCISKIENLDTLKKLRRLYLGKNSIAAVQGLEHLTRLEELSVPYQNLPVGQPLLFDLSSIHAISNSLKVLDIAGNNIKRLDQLRSLNVLEELHAEKNDIKDLADVTQTIKHWKKLKGLHLKGNAICSFPRYREHLLPSCLSLESIDGKPMSDSAKVFACKMMENSAHIKNKLNKKGLRADMQRTPKGRKSHISSSSPSIISKQTSKSSSASALSHTFANSLTIDGKKFGGN